MAREIAYKRPDLALVSAFAGDEVRNELRAPFEKGDEQAMAVHGEYADNGEQCPSIRERKADS